MTTYEELQEKARTLWNETQEITACYVQKVSDDEWRISDIQASTRGYINIQTGAVERLW